MARRSRKNNPVSPEEKSAAIRQRVYAAGGYVRLSVEDSGKPGADTIEEQKKLICGYIDEHADLRLVHLYCDNGRTGTNFERPAFDQLMNDIRTGIIDCIVVKDLSRFGRNYLETGNYLERVFPYIDVRFIAINDCFDTLTAERGSDGYIIPLKNIINEVYSRDISRKSASVLAEKQKKGEFIGTWAAYGYRKCADDPHRIEPDEETAPVVREIFSLRLKGTGYLQIARLLEARGIPSPGKYHFLKGEASADSYANSHWSVTSVQKILWSEVYLGHMVQGRKKSGLLSGQKQQRVPKSEWAVVEHTHEALIDEETFAAVQRLSEEQKAAYHQREGKYDALGVTLNLFHGLVYCADCGRTMSRYKNVTNKGKHRYYTFICRTHVADPMSCPNKNLHEDDLRRVVWERVQKEIALAGDLQEKARLHMKGRVGSSQVMELEQASIEAQKVLDKASSFSANLFRSYADGLLDEREYTEMKAQYQMEIAKAKSRLEELAGRREALKRQAKENPWACRFTRFSGETELTEQMTHELIERIEVDSYDHITITLRYRNEYQALLRFLAADGKGTSA